LKLTLHKYIIREIWPTFLAGLLVFCLVMVATRMLSITEWIINRGVHAGEAFKLVFYLMPNIVLFALPVATLIAVLIAFLRLSADNEIIALNASGISLYQMLPPVVVLSLGSYMIASIIAFYGVPWGNRSFKDTIFRIVESKVDLNIRERIFNELFDDVMFYINSISPKEKIMKDIFVVDNRDASTTNTIVAKEGQILIQPESRVITVEFRDGTIFRVEKDFESASTTRFKSYNLHMDMNDILSSIASRKKGPKEMYVRELVHYLKTRPKGNVEYNETVISLLEKFSIPLAVFFMGLIGAPLGAHIRSGTRSLGVIFGLAVFIVYYMCFMGVRNLSETGTLSPYMGVWFPDLFLAACCIAFFWRVGREGSVGLDRKISGWWKRLKEEGDRNADGREQGGEWGPSESRSRLNSEGGLHAESASPAGPSRKAENPDDFPYIGSMRAGRFHRHGGECSQKIHPGNRVFFRSRQDALDQDYAPCKICRP
jgi:lipopolysaccharide export system permease protein